MKRFVMTTVAVWRDYFYWHVWQDLWTWTDRDRRRWWFDPKLTGASHD